MIIVYLLAVQTSERKRVLANLYQFYRNNGLTLTSARKMWNKCTGLKRCKTIEYALSYADGFPSLTDLHTIINAQSAHSNYRILLCKIKCALLTISQSKVGHKAVAGAFETKYHPTIHKYKKYQKIPDPRYTGKHNPIQIHHLDSKCCFRNPRNK